MKSYFWPLLLLFVLWLAMTAVLPIWASHPWVPNLLLAGVLTLAVTDVALRWRWIIPLAGLMLDIHTGLLIGSFTIGFSFVYILAEYIFRKFIPASRFYFALPLAFFISRILLELWNMVLGFFAYNLGWPVQIIPLWYAPASKVLALIIGALGTVVLYVVWLEVLHRFDRPIRLRR